MKPWVFTRYLNGYIFIIHIYIFGVFVIRNLKVKKKKCIIQKTCPSEVQFNYSSLNLFISIKQILILQKFISTKNKRNIFYKILWDRTFYFKFSRFSLEKTEIWAKWLLNYTTFIELHSREVSHSFWSDNLFQIMFSRIREKKYTMHNII